MDPSPTLGSILREMALMSDAQKRGSDRTRVGGLDAIARDLAQESIQVKKSHDVPALRCMNDTLERGYALLPDRELLEAENAFTKASSMIEDQYGRNHYLAAKALTLLCKTLADRAYACRDAETRAELYGEARKCAQRAFDLLKAQGLNRELQIQVLQYAKVIAEALDDIQQVARISSMLDSGLF